MVTRILENCEAISGLKINKSKSAFVPIFIPPNLVQPIAAILACGPTTLPLTYLGLPLALKKLPKAAYQQLIESEQNRLCGWKGVLLSPGGRTTLVKSVLSAMSLHFMQVFLIPQGIIKHIDRTQ
jgi:hypothetical protein